MTGNTDKLLRAFIDASGFDIKAIPSVEPQKWSAGVVYDIQTTYKVTKKPFDILSDDYTDEVMRLHKTIQEANTYNEELYKETLRLKKRLTDESI